MRFTHSVILILSISGLTSCQYDGGEKTPTQNLFSTEDIGSAQFTISLDRDTILTSDRGTVLHISPNTFVDQSGNPIRGQIDIELKECLNPLDMVLSGMTTMSNGQLLESGGMVYINATSKGEQLAIANGASIGVELPTDSLKQGMQIYEGVETEDGIDWQNPVSMESDSASALDNLGEIEGEGELEEMVFDTARTNVGYYVRGYNYIGYWPNHTFLRVFEPIPKAIRNEISDICWADGGLMLKNDSVIMIDTLEVALIKEDNWQQALWPTAQKGVNSFIEDSKTNYIFSVKKLGWANIDRLFNDPRTQEIELIVKVEDHDGYDDIYSSMIFNKQSIYLPGYQKEDNTFSFTHGDYEKTSLPVGETVTILITAYKEKQPYYALETFEVEEAQTINLKLQETSKDGLKKVLESSI